MTWLVEHRELRVGEWAERRLYVHWPHPTERHKTFCRRIALTMRRSQNPRLKLKCAACRDLKRLQERGV